MPLQIVQLEKIETDCGQRHKQKNKKNIFDFSNVYKNIKLNNFIVTSIYQIIDGLRRFDNINFN